MLGSVLQEGLALDDQCVSNVNHGSMDPKLMGTVGLYIYIYIYKFDTVYPCIDILIQS